MTPLQVMSTEFDERIRRAEKLIAEKSSASQLLLFYVRIARFQKSLLAQIAADGKQQQNLQQFGSVRDGLDLTLLLPHFRGFLSLVEQHAPNALAAAARDIAGLPSDSWISMLAAYWENGGRFKKQTEAFEQFFSRAFLQPYVSYVAGRVAVPPVLTTPLVCPLCEARPLLGVLRLEGDGGKRSMVCSFCGYEWNFQRILCPACGEVEENKLPVYVAEQFPHIRVEVCETCKFCVRTIDLTKDGHAVPVVDDLSAIPLTMWAQENGYSRLQPNLLGS
ncbi:MAG TPA: formate dehydrogenase accessory protein FdhE [Candidatus Acidoferrum sp.]|nr:formate dehydrogenase accessory protein FdhE [Candidatus Acidoferrum sp.]